LDHLRQRQPLAIQGRVLVGQEDRLIYLEGIHLVRVALDVDLVVAEFNRVHLGMNEVDLAHLGYSSHLRISVNSSWVALPGSGESILMQMVSPGKQLSASANRFARRCANPSASRQMTRRGNRDSRSSCASVTASPNVATAPMPMLHASRGPSTTITALDAQRSP